MGVVYLAVRDDLPQRHVAIKLMHRGMAAGVLLERFHRERAALAGLNHPNIARLLDGGTSERGEPFLVMEYIAGRPIDEFCDSHRLTIAERLRLFQKVCAGVHHAHQHLVVHRDIKPRNILVTAEGEPKLLDFGIAKLLSPALSAATDTPTETGLRVMTPEYASPEQIRAEPITTVSDVYSLGVVLFELLTGRRPYRLKTRVWGELERVICEDDPERPSTAISRPDDAVGDKLAPDNRAADGARDADMLRGSALEQVSSGDLPASARQRASSDDSAQRSAERIGRARGERPIRLRRTLAGDLDNIVLRALRKEPQRRYASAEQLAEDIQRHLDGLPVMARPDTFGYRASKFIRRNRGGVLAGGIVVAALLAGSATAAWQARVADEERDQAQAASRRAEDARIETQRALDELRAERAKQREVARQVWLEISPMLAEEGGSVGARRALVDLCAGVYEAQALDAQPEDTAFWREYATGRLRSGSLLKGVRGAGADDLQRAIREYTSASEQFKRMVESGRGDLESAVGWIIADTMRADLLQMSQDDLGASRELLEPAVERARALLIADRSAAVVDAAAGAIQMLGDVEFKMGSDEGSNRARRLWEESSALRRERLRGDPGGLDPGLDSARRLLVASLVRQAVLAERSPKLVQAPGPGEAPGQQAGQPPNQQPQAPPQLGPPGASQAAALLAEADTLLRPMFNRDPGQPRTRRAFANLMAARAALERRRHQLGEAEGLIAEAIELTLPLLGDANDVDARRNLIDHRTVQGLVLKDLGKLEEAARVLDMAHESAALLLQRRPEDALQQQRAAAAAMALGEVLTLLDRPERLEPLERAVALYRTLHRAGGKFQSSLAKSLVLRGDTALAAGDRVGARVFYSEALPLLEAMAADPAWQDQPEIDELLRRAASR